MKGFPYQLYRGYLVNMKPWSPRTLAMVRQRVCAPGLHIGGGEGVRWWELPLQDLHHSSPAAVNKNADVRPRVDCHWSSKREVRRKNCCRRLWLNSQAHPGI